MPLRVKSEDARSIAGTSLTGTYQNVGSALSNSAKIIFVFNGCDDAITLSWDGGDTDGFILPANSAFSADFSANPNDHDQRPELPKGAQFQAKHNGSAPTAGTLSVSVVYV